MMPKAPACWYSPDHYLYLIRTSVSAAGMYCDTAALLSLISTAFEADFFNGLVLCGTVVDFGRLSPAAVLQWDIFEQQNHHGGSRS